MTKLFIADGNRLREMRLGELVDKIEAEVEKRAGKLIRGADKDGNIKREAFENMCEGHKATMLLMREIVWRAGCQTVDS